MGTKENPGNYDCYANARPDEPIFVLLGRDPCAAFAVKLWTILRSVAGSNDDSDKLAEAEKCAKAMLEYAGRHGKGSQLVAAGAYWGRIMAAFFRGQA